jgi:hypothetical protein
MPLPALIAAAQEIEIKGVFRRLARVRLKKSRSRKIETLIVRLSLSPKPHFRGLDLNNTDYQWLAGHLAF